MDDIEKLARLKASKDGVKTDLERLAEQTKESRKVETEKRFISERAMRIYFNSNNVDLKAKGIRLWHGFQHKKTGKWILPIIGHGCKDAISTETCYSKIAPNGRLRKGWAVDATARSRSVRRSKKAASEQARNQRNGVKLHNAMRTILGTV